MARKAHLALYGGVAMERHPCPGCGGEALVVGGLLQCCDRPVGDERILRVVREVEADGVRRSPSIGAQQVILDAQERRCLYCNQEFGSRQYRQGSKARAVRLHVEWDHLIPFSYTYTCIDEAFVAACQVCNGIKSATVYRTLDDARADLAIKRSLKGWSF